MTTINSECSNLTNLAIKSETRANVPKPRKLSQKETVYSIVAQFQPVRTEQIQRQALFHGISSSCRRLRELQEDGRISSYKLTGDRTSTWVTKKQGELL